MHRLLFLFLLAAPVQDIVVRAIQALGGAENFAAINSLRTQGRMRIGQAASTPFTVTARRPNLFRMELTFGPDRVTQAFDGAIGWQSIAGPHAQEPTVLTGDSLAHLIDQAANAIGGPLLDLEKRHNTVELLGTEPVNGVACYQLKITLNSGNTRILFIDSSSFREILEETPIEVNGKPSVIQQSVGDYRRFGPILVPCLFVTREKGGEDNQRLEIESVEINPAAEASIFKLPAKK